MDLLLATDYINLNCVDTEEWIENASDEQRTRCLNVAQRTLKREFREITPSTTLGLPPLITEFFIPDDAVFEFANVLCIMFSDTNKLQTHGMNSLTINGLGTFDFGSKQVRTAGDIDYSKFIPQIARDLINEYNGTINTNRRVKWTTV
jgi:hypothetical protein